MSSEAERKLNAGFKKRIYINRYKIRDGEPDPISVHTSSGVITAQEVDILGDSRVVYQPNKPSNPRVWVETWAEVAVDAGR